MKNIIIMGVGRAGKTTLSEMLKRKYPQYNVIHADTIKWGIINAQRKEAKFRKDIEKQMKWEKSEFFQDILIETFVHNIKNKYTPVIMETGQLYLEHLINHPKYSFIQENTDIIVLGIGNKTSQKRVQECRAYDMKDDWSYNVPDELLLKHAADWEIQDLKRMKECKQYGVLYHDTSINRMKILNEICEKYKGENYELD